MNTNKVAMLAIALSSMGAITADAAENQLYPTGPAEDSSFVRFVNASPTGVLEVNAVGSDSKLTIGTDSRASPYMPVASRTKIEGELKQGEDTQKIDLKSQPGEFLTVLGFKTNQGLQALEVREAGDGFSAVRASIAFYSMSDQCQAAAIQVAGRSVFLFEDVKVGQWVRRQVNPVALSLQLMCAGEPVGKPLDLGLLDAGGRYSLFLLPGDPSERFFQVKDTVTN